MSKKDVFLAILITAIWGSNYSVIELGLESLNPFLITAFRFTACAIPLCFFVRRPKVKFYFVVAYGLVFGVGLWGVANLSMKIGLPAGVASLLLQFSAFFTIVQSAVFFKEKIKNIQYIGMLVAIAGLILIVINSQGKFPLLSIFLILVSGFCWSICNLIIKKSRPAQMMSFIIWSSLFSALPLFATTYLVDGSTPFLTLKNSLTITAVFSIFFQAYITTLIGYWVWNMLIKKYAAVSIAPVSLLIPVFGLLTSYIMFGEPIDAIKIISAVLIIAGTFILIYNAKILELYNKYTCGIPRF